MKVKYILVPIISIISIVLAIIISSITYRAVIGPMFDRYEANKLLKEYINEQNDISFALYKAEMDELKSTMSTEELKENKAMFDKEEKKARDIFNRFNVK